MPDEIDRLEIAVEAKANRANRALGGMEKKLNKIADSLEKVTALTAGINGFDKFDASGLEKFKKELDSIFRSPSKKSVKVDDSSLKYAKKSMQELQNQYKDAKLEVDISTMGEAELKKFISQTERGYNRLKQTLADTIKLNGSDIVGGKAWYRANMQLMQYENALDDATEALGRMKSVRNSMPELSIDRGVSFDSGTSYFEKPRAAETGNYKQYDASEIEDFIDNFAGATSEANTFEAQIKRLKAELSDLASNGFSQYDPEYDSVARELAEVTESQKQYNKSLREAARQNLGIGNFKDISKEIGEAAKKAGIFKRTIDGVKSSSKKINSLKKSFDSVGKSIKNARKIASGAIHPIKTLSNLLSGENRSRKGMSWGRMIGSSLLFNFVFKGISAIQNAIKEGSDNLVQYSSEYNHSISSMVSSLLYLKNAWAAAFSPITNAVAPYISEFIDMVASAVNVVGQFMAALTGRGFAVQSKKVWKDYAEGLDTTKKSAGEAEKAIKDLKNYTLGIDEFNLIQPNDNSGSAGGSGGTSDISPADMFETVEVSNSMSKLAGMFKEAIESSDFTEIGRLISNKLSEELEGIEWKSVYKNAEKFGKGLATFLNGLITPRLFYDLGKTIANSINTAFHFANAFAINFDWINLGKSLARSIKGFFKNWDAGLTANTFSNFGKGFLKSLTEFIDSIGKDNTFEDIGQKIVDFIFGIDWLGLSWDTAKFFEALMNALYDFPKDFAKGIAESIVKNIFGVDIDIKIPKWIDSISKQLTPSIIPGFKELSWLPDPVSVSKKLIEIGDFISAFKDSASMLFNDLKKNIIDAFCDIPAWFKEKFESAIFNVKSAWGSVGTWFAEKWESIKKPFSNVKKWFRDAFKSAYDAVKSVWDGIGKYFRGIANDIIKPIGKAVNGVISGVNWVLGKVGSGTRISAWTVPQFAKGTGGLPEDTIGMVNDQKGANYKELIVPPKGSPFIPKGRNVVLPMQKGTKIMPANETKAFLDRMPKFAKGIGDFFGGAWESFKNFTGDVLGYITDPKKIVQIAIDKFVDTTGWNGVIGDMASGAIKTMLDSVVNFVKKIFDSTGAAGVEKAVKWAVGIANDNSHGYDQASRWGNPDYDCSSLIISAFEQAGIKLKSAGATYTGNMYGTARSIGFADVTGSTNLATASGMKRGDILLNRKNHVAMYLGNGQIVQASINEKGGITGGKPGDQTGREIWTRSYYNFPWNDVLRYVGKAYKDGIGKIGYKDVFKELPMLANGGLLRNGQIFVARERGPEFVGKYGNRSAVINNDQIVQSVSSGVETAVEKQNAITNALLRQVVEYQKLLLEKDTSVNIDGKKADKQLTKARRNSGYSFSPA